MEFLIARFVKSIIVQKVQFQQLRIKEIGYISPKILILINVQRLFRKEVSGKLLAAEIFKI